MSEHSFLDLVYPALLDPPASQGDAQTAYIAPFADEEVDRYAFLLSWGAVGTSIDAAVLQATSSGGAGEKAVTGAVMTLTNVANKWMVIDIGPGALDIKNGFHYVSLSVDVEGTVVWQVLGFGYKARYPGTKAAHTTQHEDVRVYFQE